MNAILSKITINWKTSAAGLAMIFSALSDILHGLTAGTPINWQIALTALAGGIGLLTAKDANVTGGSKQQ